MEVTENVSGHCHSEEQIRCGYSLMCAAVGCCTGDEKSTSQPHCGVPGAEDGTFSIYSHGVRVLALDIRVDDSSPCGFDVLDELGGHSRTSDRHGTGHDERRLVPSVEESLDHGAHQPKDSTGPLEPFQGGPILVQPVEELRMDRIGTIDPFFVCALPHVGRQFTLIGPVIVDELARGGPYPSRGLGVGFFEQTPSHDLEALYRTGRLPLMGGSSDDVLESFDRFDSVFPSGLEVVERSTVVVLPSVRGGNRHEHKSARCLRSCFRQRLCEGELRVEGSADKIVAIVELTRVGHPLVDKDDAWRL